MTKKDYSIGEYYMMSVRILYSQCLQENFFSKPYKKSVDGIFNFAAEINGDVRAFCFEYPSLAYVDRYGHTAIDGLSFDQLLNKDLPKLKQQAVVKKRPEIARQIDDFLQFVQDAGEEFREGDDRHGDHWMIVLDGA
jgi:hypothetical protein